MRHLVAVQIVGISFSGLGDCLGDRLGRLDVLSMAAGPSASRLLDLRRLQYVPTDGAQGMGQHQSEFTSCSLAYTV